VLGVAPQLGGQVVGVDDQLELLGGGGRAHHRGDPGDQGIAREVHLFELELAGLDLGQVQDVVDDLQQVVGGHVDALQAVALARVLEVALDQVGQADDGVHRGADLVAHVGQEGALGAGGGFGLVGPLGQGLVGGRAPARSASGARRRSPPR
jgi:hypothetical protein